MEYDAAVKQDVDIVPFMLAEDAPWPRKFDELDKDPWVRTWREQLRKNQKSWCRIVWLRASVNRPDGDVGPLDGTE